MTLITNIYINLIVVFFVALTVSHLLFVWPKNLSSLHWKYIDYLWFSLASIAAMFAASEIRQEHYKFEALSASHYIQVEKESFLNFSVLGTKRYFCDFKNSPLDARAAYEQFCAWLDSLAKEVLRNSHVGKHSRALIKVQEFEPTEDIIIEEVSLIEDRLSEVNQTVLKYKESERQSEPSYLERIIYIFWPYIFVIGLAVRMSKISGEIRIEANKNRHCDS